MKTRNWFKSIKDLIRLEKYIYRIKFRGAYSWTKFVEIREWVNSNELDYVYDEPYFYFKSQDDVTFVKLTHDDVEVNIYP